MDLKGSEEEFGTFERTNRRPQWGSIMSLEKRGGVKKQMEPWLAVTLSHLDFIQDG